MTLNNYEYGTGEKPMPKKMIIIGAGMGGLAAGIYGQINRYETQVFEMHTRSGGQCASWKRKGYTFDACIHHFFGCKPGSSINRLWQELGAMPREIVPLEECTAVVSSDGKMFIDYYDPAKLKETMLELSPADSKLIEEYVKSIKAFNKNNMTDMMLGTSFSTIIKSLPSLSAIRKWSKIDMGNHAKRFSDPFLRRAVALLMYSNPSIATFMHLLWQAGGLSKDIQWPVGGAAELAKSIERHYLNLGGKVHYSSRVEKILVENDRAVGIKLIDGSKHRADIIISNADGRKTIFDLLGGKYINETVRSYCTPITDETPFAVSVFLGVNRDLSSEPSSLIMLLDQPITIASHEYESIEAQFYGFDKTMAPPGKGTIKVELPASYAYWKQIYTQDREKYKQEKHQVAEKVIGLLGKHFPGIKDQVEVVDVVTLMTWERFMGGSQGWFNLPNRKVDFSTKADISDKKFKMTLPGLSNFYFVGIWVTMMASLFNNANSGKTIIRCICKKDGINFKAQTQP